MNCPSQLFLKAEDYRRSMQITEALALYNSAEDAGYAADRCGAARWTCYMLTGAWEQAWCESDAIAQRGTPDSNRFWDGSDWAGKDILIRCLHGLGDTLQFIRYAIPLRTQARTLTLEAQPKLKVLLRNSGLADRVITWGEPEPEWQVQMEVNELPRLFRTTALTIPNQVPYLRAADRPKERDRDGELKVGVVWAASNFDTSRNIPLAMLRSLYETPGTSFFSLQSGEGWTESLPSEIANIVGFDTSIEQVADEMVELDLIVTVDTMNAHLAGALGLRTWTMLPFQCDWRWMMERIDTPWYPTMRLFRQPSPGDWESVVQQMKAALLVMKQERIPPPEA